MSKALQLYFEAGGPEGPKLVRTKFRPSDEDGGTWRIVYEHRELEQDASVNGRFYWNDRSHAIRGFTLLCIRHFLSSQNGAKNFTLKGEAQFAPALGESVRSSKPERASKWLLAIVGTPEFQDQAGLRLLFDYSTDYSQVKFRPSEWGRAIFHFFLGEEEITTKPEVLSALADAIQGDGKRIRPMERLDERPPQPALSLRVYSPGDGFLSVRTPETAALLRQRGLLPLRHDAIGQLHVHFEQPQHFCLFAFGSDGEVNSYVPHPNCPAGEAKENLVIPGDLIPGTEELVFGGPGGAESFILLVSEKALSQKQAVAAQRKVVEILKLVRSFKLADAGSAFFIDEPLEPGVPAPNTRKLDLKTARPFSGPLERFLAEIRGNFSTSFSGFHFISVDRLHPPTPRAKHS